MTQLRLSKLMSEKGICSRREADRFIERGLVRVDGEIVSELGTKVSHHSVIELLPQAKKRQAGKVTIILNKPIGYVSTQPEKGYRPAIDLIVPSRQWKGSSFDPSHLIKLSVAGRLDIDSKGLLILTQDGVIAKALIGENTDIEKEYLVRIEGAVTPESLQRLKHGLSIEGKSLKRAQVNRLEDNILRIVLSEGKKRQIRKMCEMVGLKVVGLKRVRVGGVRLGDLPEGKWRYLKKSETF
jgi:23S rRNA pseudouridine2604 synthase